MQRKEFEKVSSSYGNPMVQIVHSGLSRSNETLDHNDNNLSITKNNSINEPFFQESKSANQLDAKSINSWIFNKKDSHNCESDSNLSFDAETTRL